MRSGKTSIAILKVGELMEAVVLFILLLAHGLAGCLWGLTIVLMASMFALRLRIPAPLPRRDTVLTIVVLTATLFDYVLLRMYMRFRCERRETSLRSRKKGIRRPLHRWQLSLQYCMMLVAAIALAMSIVLWVARLPSAVRIAAFFLIAILFLEPTALWAVSRWRFYLKLAAADRAAKRWEKALIEAVSDRGKSESPKYRELVTRLAEQAETFARKRSQLELWWCPRLVVSLYHHIESYSQSLP
jgi:hypothetical protein